MSSKVHVKKGDTIIVLSGKDKGRKGKILSVNPSKEMVLVEGVNMTTKHAKPRSRDQQGGLIHQESPIRSSKVMLVCERCHKPTRVAKVFLDNGQKARKCKKCDEIIDVISTSEVK